jgi:hypothetical protein
MKKGPLKMPMQKINPKNADPKTIWSLLLGISDNDWDKLNDDFQNIALQLSELPQKIEKAVHEITSFLEKKRPEIENIISFLEDQQFHDAVFSTFIQTIHKGLSQHGYFLGLSFLQWGRINEIGELLRRRDASGIKEYVLGFLREKKHIDNLINKWSRNPYFESRLQYLTRGLNAHIDADYIASIPILLPHVEGILYQFIVDKGLYSNSRKDFQGNTALDKLKQITLEGICSESDKVAFRRFLHKKKVYEYKEDRSAFLNRGQIFHGICLDYEKEEWSAQLIFLLDYLNDLTSKKLIITTKK